MLSNKINWIVHITSSCYENIGIRLEPVFVRGVRRRKEGRKGAGKEEDRQERAGWGKEGTEGGRKGWRKKGRKGRREVGTKRGSASGQQFAVELKRLSVKTFVRDHIRYIHVQ